MEYRIVVSRSDEDHRGKARITIHPADETEALRRLERRVNSHMFEGWKPLGGMTAVVVRSEIGNPTTNAVVTELLRESNPWGSSEEAQNQPVLILYQTMIRK